MVKGLASLVPKNSLGTSIKTESIDGAVERAIFVEAALAAVMAVPVERFEEEFWYTMSTTVNRIAPIVLRTVPGVYKSLESTVRGVLGHWPRCGSLLDLTISATAPFVAVKKEEEDWMTFEAELVSTKDFDGFSSLHSEISRTQTAVAKNKAKLDALHKIKRSTVANRHPLCNSRVFYR